MKRADALDYVLAYTCANGVRERNGSSSAATDSDAVATSSTPSRRSSRASSRRRHPESERAAHRSVLNGKAVQDWNTNDMIFDVPVIEFLSGSTTLVPGTVILTGTPHGVGTAAKPPRWLKPGDTFTIEIEKTGKLTNPVINAA